jgi:hypothetical protein
VVRIHPAVPKSALLTDLCRAETSDPYKEVVESGDDLGPTMIE